MRRLAPLALLAATLLPGSASAQDTAINGSSYGNWLLSCQALGVAQTRCSLIQELTLAETGGLVARLLVTELQGGPTLVAQVPMGVYLPSGLVYQVEEDSEPQREMIWQRCLADICEAALALDDAEIERLSDGTMLVGYRPAPGTEPVIVRIQLDGFGDGVAAIFGNG